MHVLAFHLKSVNLQFGLIPPIRVAFPTLSRPYLSNMAQQAPQIATTWHLYRPTQPGMIQNGLQIAQHGLVWSPGLLRCPQDSSKLGPKIVQDGPVSILVLMLSLPAPACQGPPSCEGSSISFFYYCCFHSFILYPT